MMGWLLWAAYGTTATMNAFGFPPLLSTVSTYHLLVNFLGGCADVFFRQIAVAGAHKLNTSNDPLLLAIAPHSNQFIDPMIILKTFERPVGFLCAAKSMRYKRSAADCIAFFAQVLQAVPVERAQDLAKPGAGTVVVVVVDDRRTVHGTGTRFTADFKVGDQLMPTEGEAKGASARVAEIVSDTILTLGSDLTVESSGEVRTCSAAAKFKVIPKVDQHDMYASVYERLSDGGVIGIFPEGGSHDRASLLPLKAGIAVMGLGACAVQGEALRSKLKIVAVGLNYFSGHRFRSRVFVDYGEPFEISKELVDLYATNKRAAGDALMKEILQAIKAVTVQAADSSTQEVLWMLRRLYVRDGQKLTLEQKVGLTRGFASGCERDDALPEVKALLTRVAHYNDQLKVFGIHDRRVLLSGVTEDYLLEPIDAITMIAIRIAILLSYCIAIVPGLFLASPLLLVSELVSRHQAKAAVAGSRVKLEGKDVIGTWKVLVGILMVPIMHVTYTAAVFYLASFKLAVLYFFFMPFISATSIIASERFFDVARSIGPLWMLLFNKQSGADLRTAVLEIIF